MRKQSKKFLSLCLALVMALGTLTVPASACTADTEGNVIPCEQVEEKGYCDSSLIFFYTDEEQTQLSFMNNPYYKAVKDTAPTGGTTGNISGEGERIGHSTPGNGLMPADEFFEMQIRKGYHDIVDYDNWTIYYVDENGQTTGYKVIDPEYNDVSFFYPDGTPVDAKDRGKLDFTAENPFSGLENADTKPDETQEPVRMFDPKDVPSENDVLSMAFHELFSDILADPSATVSYGPENWTIHTDECDAVFRLKNLSGEVTYTNGASKQMGFHKYPVPYVMTDEGIFDTDTGKLVADTDGYPIENERLIKPPKTVKKFDDVPEDAWYAEAVNAMAANGILNGYSDGLFHPERNVTIGELAVIIYRLATNEDPVGMKGQPEGVYASGYFGYSDHWAAYAVDTLSTREVQYLGGYRPTIAYRPSDGYRGVDSCTLDATRAEAINAVYLLARETGHLDESNIIEKYDFDFGDWDTWKPAAWHTYTDAELQEKSGIPDFAINPDLGYDTSFELLKNVTRAYKYGIVHGVDAEGNCRPNDSLTRAELCQMLYNAGITGYTVPANFKASKGWDMRVKM